MLEGVELTIDYRPEHYEVNSQMVCQWGAANCVKLDKMRSSEQKKAKGRVKEFKKDSLPGDVDFSAL